MGIEKQYIRTQNLWKVIPRKVASLIVKQRLFNSRCQQLLFSNWLKSRVLKFSNHTQFKRYTSLKYDEAGNILRLTENLIEALLGKT